MVFLNWQSVCTLASLAIRISTLWSLLITWLPWFDCQHRGLSASASILYLVSLSLARWLHTTKYFDLVTYKGGRRNDFSSLVVLGFYSRVDLWDFRNLIIQFTVLSQIPYDFWTVKRRRYQGHRCVILVIRDLQTCLKPCLIKQTNSFGVSLSSLAQWEWVKVTSRWFRDWQSHLQEIFAQPQCSSRKTDDSLDLSSVQTLACG